MSISINGKDLKTNYGFLITEPVGFPSIGERRQSTLFVPGRVGERVSRRDTWSREVTIRGVVRGTTVADRNAKLDKLKVMLSAATLTVVLGDDTSRQLTCELRRISHVGANAPYFITRDLPVEITLFAADGQWYSVAATAVNGIANVATALPLGTGVHRPTLTIRGASTNPSIIIRNSAGTQISNIDFPAMSLLAGESVVIDLDKLTILKGVTNMMGSLGTSSILTALDAAIHAVYDTSSWPDIRVTSGTLDVGYNKAWR